MDKQKTFRSKRLPHVTVTFRFNDTATIRPFVAKFPVSSPPEENLQWSVEETAEILLLLNQALPKAMSVMKAAKHHVPDHVKHLEYKEVKTNESEHYSRDFRGLSGGSAFIPITTPFPIGDED